MELTTEAGRSMTVTTPGAVSRALAHLGEPGTTFATLSRSDGSFFQATTSRRAGFLVECSDAHDRRLFQSVRRDLARDEVLALFLAWFENPAGSWRADLAWITVDLDDDARPLSRAPAPSTRSTPAERWDGPPRCAAPARGRVRPAVLAVACELLLVGAGAWAYRTSGRFSVDAATYSFIAVVFPIVFGVLLLARGEDDDA